MHADLENRAPSAIQRRQKQVSQKQIPDIRGDAGQT